METAAFLIKAGTVGQRRAGALAAAPDPPSLKTPRRTLCGA